MGLDMYLRAKTTKRDYTGATGACGGLFTMAPEDNGMVEIGYWRKAYDQQALFTEVISSFDSGHDNCVHFKVEKNEIEEIIETAKAILAEVEFDEDGSDPTSEYYTAFSQDKWIDTVEYFTEALKILEEDPEAEIYYCQWS